LNHDEPVDRTLLLRYLLGESVEPDDETRLEEAFFASDAALRQIEDLEDELIDRFVTNDLPAGQLEQVRRRIESSDRWREKHELARRLHAAALPGNPSPGRSPAAARTPRLFGFSWTRPAWGAAAAVAVVAVGLWIWMSTPVGPPGQPGVPAPPSGSARPALPVVTVSIGSPAARAGRPATPEVSLPATEVAVELRIWLGLQRYENYRARLLPDGAAAVQPIPDSAVRTEKSAVGGHTVFVRLPSGRLPSGTHRVVLDGGASGSGWEEVGTYPFHVSRP
jgi:hypothetical protein